MARTVVLTIAAISLGAAMGALGVRARLVASVAERDRVVKERDDLERTYNKLQAEAELMAKQLARLESDEKSLRAQIAELQADMVLEAPPSPIEAALLPLESTPALTEEPESRRDRSRFRRSGALAPFGEEDRGSNDEDRQARAARREEFAAEMRDRFRERIDTEVATTTDPAARARLTMIRDYSETMMALRQQLRAAETDEEREAVRLALEDTGAALQGLFQEQEEYTLRQLATQYGITGAEQQDAFIESLNETRSNSLTRWPGMRGGPRFGRGGPPPPP